MTRETQPVASAEPVCNKGSLSNIREETGAVIVSQEETLKLKVSEC